MQVMKMVWKLQRLVNTGLDYPVISTSVQPLSATNFSYSLSQPLRFSIFQIQPVLLPLAPQHEFCYLKMSLLFLFLSLAFLDWLLSMLQRPFKCHIFRAAFPAVLTQISACSNVSSLTAWELHKNRGCETSGQSSCHIAALSVYWFELNGEKAASQAGNGIYTNSCSNEEWRMISWVFV